MITTHEWTGWYATAEGDSRPSYSPCETETPRGQCGRPRHEHEHCATAAPLES